LSSSNLVRAGGLAAALGALIFIVVDLIALLALNFDQRLSEVVTSFGWYFQSTLSLVAGTLVMLGLICLYARRSEEMSTFGLSAFLVAFSGLVLAQGVIWDTSFTAPSIAIAAPELLGSRPPGLYMLGAALSLALPNLGLLLFGVAVLRDGFYPRPAAVLLIVGATLTGLTGALMSGWPNSSLLKVGVGMDIILEAGLIWLGLSLVGRAGVPSLYQRQGSQKLSD
jgi:hypothetical protein